MGRVFSRIGMWRLRERTLIQGGLCVLSFLFFFWGEGGGGAFCDDVKDAILVFPIGNKRSCLWLVHLAICSKEVEPNSRRSVTFSISHHLIQFLSPQNRFRILVRSRYPSRRLYKLASNGQQTSSLYCWTWSGHGRISRMCFVDFHVHKRLGCGWFIFLV